MKKIAVGASGVALFLVSLAACATDSLPTTGKADDSFQANVELGYGHEHYSSPLVRFNDQGPLIEIVGRRHAEGEFRHFSGSVMKSFLIAQDTSLQVSTTAWNRQFPNAPDLNIGILSLDTLLRFQHGKSSVGIGPSFQQITSGGHLFRERRAIQIDWTRFKDSGGYSSVVFESGDNRHSEQFRDLDSHSSLLLVREQFVAPFADLQEVFFEAGVARERNRFGFADLANRLAYVRVGLGFDMLGLDWNIVASTQKARFDGALMDDLPARKDTFYSADLSASYSLSKDLFLRWTFSGYQNRANLVLYDGSFRGNSLSVNATF